MEFMLGCNYWASNAGTEMWRNFSEDSIRSDMEILSEHGVKHIRAFPIWRDFQPVMPLLAASMQLFEYCMDDETPKTNPYYISDVMMDRFAKFLDICGEYNVKVVVGLVTGWMSGRMFVPSALIDKNIISDPLALYFQQLFIKGFVSHFKDREEIIAWDLGNECNCMSSATRITASNWTATVANAIKSEDNTRPVVSGMSGLEIDMNGKWLVEDQALFNDILTTHPYPLWGMFTKIDKTLSLRTTMYATAMTKLYADIGGKPCMAEEIGTMGPTICSDEKAADFFRLNLFSLWANNSCGVMWWCASDQTMLDSFPYSRSKVELELGMLDKNHKPKPVLVELKKFAGFFDNLDFELPAAQSDAVCLLTDEQRQWGVAYMTYILLRQSGLNCTFAYANSGLTNLCKNGELPDSKLYIVPSISGTNVMKKKRYEELRQRVYDGADVYISVHTGILSEFESFTGLSVEDSYEFSESNSLLLDGEEIKFKRFKNFILKPTTAKVLAYDKDNNPAITVNNYGKGRVFFVNFPLEDSLIDMHNGFDSNVSLVYKKLLGEYADRHPFTVKNNNIAVTYHKTENGYIAVLVNHSENNAKLELSFNGNWQVSKEFYGRKDEIKAFDACVLELVEKN